MNIFTERQIGYLAGVIDGEGSITIHIRKPLPSNKYRLYYRPVIGVYNTDKRLLDYVRDICGIGWVGKHSKRRGYQTLYQFQLGQKIEIHHFLQQIKDDLCIKKDQAQLMIRYIESRGLDQFHPHKGVKRGVDKQAYTIEELDIIERLHQLHMKTKTGEKKPTILSTVNAIPTQG